MPTATENKPVTKVAQPTPKSSIDAGALIDLKHITWVLRERWLGALVLVLLVCGLIGFILLSQPAVYQASAALLVERSNDRVMDIKQVVDNSVEGNLTDTIVLTHIEQIKSHTFLVSLVKSLSAEERRKVLAPYAKAEESRKSDIDEAGTEDPEIRRIEKFLNTNLKAERNGRTLLITLTVSHRDPAMAQFLVNRAAECYISHLIDRSSASNSAASAFLGTQSEELKKKVEESERELQAYREKYNLVSVEDNQNIVVARLKDLNVAVTQARVTTLSLRTRLEQAQKMVNEGADVAKLSSFSEFAALVSVQRDIEDLKTKRAVLAERYGRNHPVMQDNISALVALGKVARQQVENALSDMQSQMDKALAQETRLQAELADAEKESLRLDQLAVKYNVLRRQVETDRALYTQVLSRQNETAITSQLQNTNIKLVDRAGFPVKPTDPNKLKIALIVGLLAIAIGLGYPLIADLMDQRVRYWSDIETYLEIPLLAEVGSLSNMPEKDREWLVIKDLDEIGAETFRGLYSQLQLTSTVETPKTILVTSSMPNEGKSFVAGNMAAAFAAHQKRVLLVDGDFRRPSQHKAFQLDNKQGIISWLEAKLPASGDLTKEARLGIVELSPNLSLLRTGGISRKASELLDSSAMASLLENLQRSYDIVIIDTPPAGLFPDAEAFSKVADEIVFVCRFGAVRRPQAKQTITRLRKTNLPIAGAVLNAMPTGRGQAYYYSSYSYKGYKYYKQYYGEHSR